MSILNIEQFVDHGLDCLVYPLRQEWCDRIIPVVWDQEQRRGRASHTLYTSKGDTAGLSMFKLSLNIKYYDHITI